MRVLLFSATCLLISLASFQRSIADDCSLDFTNVHSVLHLDPKKVAELSVEKRDTAKRIVQQYGELKGGQKYSYTAGGCAHFAYSFRFEKVPVKGKKAEAVFGKALELLARVPVTKGDDKKSGLVKSLKDGRKKPTEESPGVYVLPCGDGHCVLDTREGALVVSYDFAL